jgi:hypothetical protein
MRATPGNDQATWKEAAGWQQWHSSYQIARELHRITLAVCSKRMGVSIMLRILLVLGVIHKQFILDEVAR